MNLKQIEDKVKKEYKGEKYKALCEMIEEGELSIKFLETQTAIETMGKESVELELKRTKQAVDIRKAEKIFLEQL